MTPLGVVLVRTDESLTAEFGNDVFAGLLPAERLPFEGRPWGELAGSDGEGRLAAAAREVAGSGRCRTVPGFRPCRGEQSPPPVWDLDLCPVTQAGGAVTHVLMAIRDVSPEVRAAQRLEPLAIGASDLRRASDAGQVLAAAVRHAGSLLPNAGSLVALVRDGEPEGIDVIAADGVWARTDQAGEPDLRLTLIRDVARTGTTIEIERAGVLDSVESLRIVPLLAAPALRRRTAVLGTLALSRLDSGPFSAVDRLLMDEFAGRVGAALRLAQHLGPTGRPLPPAD